MTRLILDYVFEHEAARREHPYLTQPVAGGQVIDYSWGEVLDQARRMAAHLHGLGLPRAARIAILSKNCAHFFIAELSIWLAGYTTVALFPTDTAQTIRFVLAHSEASLLFVGKLDKWPQQRSAVDAQLPCIALPLAPPTAYEGWDTIIARTPPMSVARPRAADELAMLIYTSGSTGQPKGVMLSFGALTRAAEGVTAEIRRRLGNAGDCRMLSYLPLAHVFERAWVEAQSYVNGRAHVFFAESLETFVQDLRRARPTLFLSVPSLWLKFQQGVFAKMPAARLDRLLRVPLLGRLVGRKVLEGLGLEQVVVAASGAAPIPAELIAWYRRLGLGLYEGYAMTEDCGYSHVSDEAFNAPGHVGVPLPGVSARIGDEGEILIKSPGQFSGYYKEPALTAASFTQDGFFRTGDVGEIRPDGLLKLTGRAKDLFKTAKGKYVAPAPIEMLLNAHPMVAFSLVAGHGLPAPYGIVVLADEVQRRAQDAEVRRRVSEDFERLLETVNGKLSSHEKLQMIVIAREAWSIDNGLLTPTMKVRRFAVEAAAAAELDQWLASGARVHWA